MAADSVLQDAQLSLDRFLSGPGDARERRTATGACTTVGEIGDAEPLLALPPLPYPASLLAGRVVADNASVAFRGNRYSVPPGLAGVELELRHRLGTATVEVFNCARFASRTGPVRLDS